MYIVITTSKDNSSAKTWKVFGTLKAAEWYRNQLNSDRVAVSICKGWW